MNTNPSPSALSEAPRPAITLHPVESNQVGAIGYDEATKTLAVQFKRGARAIYHYPGVEPETYAAFKGAGVSPIRITGGMSMLRNTLTEVFVKQAPKVAA